MMNNYNKGFTLIEILIALVLGSLIIAAGFAVFISGQRSAVLQSGMGELQQNANFGLGVLTQDLRHANLNTLSSQKINNRLVGSGIIFSTKNLPSSFNASNLTFLMTTANQDASAISSATTGRSDQLTIQYMPEYTKNTKTEKVTDATGVEKDVEVTTYSFRGVDCEGDVLEFDEPRVIVQRYHLKPDTVQITGLPTAYSLYCDAGNYASGDTEIEGITATTNGQQLIQKIDAFNVRLGIKAPDKKMRYVSITDYLALMPETATSADPVYNIQSVEIGLLARSTLPLTNESLINNGKTFELNGTEVNLNTTHVNGPKYLREVFSQVVAFRNTLGAS